MRIIRVHTLALDPGVTTGWCLLDDHGHVEGSGNLKAEELAEGLDEIIRQVNRTGHELEVVVETLAPGRQGPLHQALTFVKIAIDRVVHQTFDLKTVEVTPGTWKTSAAARPMKSFTAWNDIKTTQHQRDAYGIGLWRISKRAKKTPFRHVRWSDLK